MDKRQQAHYQRIVEQLRTRHTRDGTGWPGKHSGEPAITRYPNIAAEMNAVYYYSLENFATWANVTPEIMAAVLEDGEELGPFELWRLCRNLNVNPNYLASHTLQIIDADTNKGKRRMWELQEAARILEEDLPWGETDRIFNRDDAKTLSRIREKLRRGEPVTYAGFQAAMNAASRIRGRKKRMERRPRSERLTGGGGDKDSSGMAAEPPAPGMPL